MSENYKEIQEQLTNRIEEHAKQHEKYGESYKPITDGIVCPEKYGKSKYRILWVLKEAYDEVDDGIPWSEGFNYADVCFGMGKPENEREHVYLVYGFKGNHTFYRMAYTTYAVLTDKNYGDCPWIYQDMDIADSLRDIAIINTGKFPGFHRTSKKTHWQNYEFWKPVLLEQIKQYNPQIVIFGYTADPYAQDLGLNFKPIRPNDWFTAYDFNEGCLYIHAYHPSAHVCATTYVDDIVDLVRKYRGDLKD